MNPITQGLAFFLLLGLAVLADGLMDALGPGLYLLVNGIVVVVAWALIEWPAPQKKSRLRGRYPRRRRDQPNG